MSGPAPGRPPPMMLGVTGPIGCGKSTVARWLGEEGAAVIDADVLAREATAPGSATLPAIRSRFGASVFWPDGSLDRAALAGIVFSDAAALRDLEAIVHPRVRELLLLRVAAAASRPSTAAVVIEAIKLVEGGYAAACDEVWVVSCSPGVQRERLRGRGAPDEDVERRIAAQGHDAVARLVAAARDLGVPVRVVGTDGDRESVREAVRSLFRQLRARWEAPA